MNITINHLSHKPSFQVDGRADAGRLTLSRWQRDHRNRKSNMSRDIGKLTIRRDCSAIVLDT